MPWIYKVSGAVYEGDKLTGWELLAEGTANEIEEAGQIKDARQITSYLHHCHKLMEKGGRVKKIWEREWRPTERELWPSPACYKTPDRPILDKATGKVTWEWSWDREQATADRMAGTMNERKKAEARQKRWKRDRTPGVLHEKKSGRGSYIYTRTGQYISNPSELMLDVIQMERDNDERRRRGLKPWNSYGQWRLNGGRRTE